MSGLRLAASWLLCLFLIAMYVQGTIHPLPNPPVGSVKLYDLPGENILFETLSRRSGYVMFEPTGRVVTGVLELITAFFLLIPFTRRFGAFCSCLILFCAISLHMSPWLGQEIPVSLLPGETATDGGAMFALSIAMMVVSILVIVVHPSRAKRRRF